MISFVFKNNFAKAEVGRFIQVLLHTIKRIGIPALDREYKRFQSYFVL